MERPDYDDFDQAAQDAVRMAGLPTATELYWDGDARGGDNLGIVASFDLADVDTDYLSEPLAAAYAGLDSRWVDMSVYAYGTDSLTPERCAFISVALTDEEADRVYAHMTADGVDDFYDDAIGYWRRGDARGMMDCFGYSAKGLRETWDAVSAAVRAVVTGAGQALDFLAAARASACETFASECEYLCSDEFQAELAEMDEIIEAFECAVRRGEVDAAWRAVDMMFEDILDVIRGAVAGRVGIPEVITREVANVVDDFLTNNYGD